MPPNENGTESYLFKVLCLDNIIVYTSKSLRKRESVMVSHSESAEMSRAQTTAESSGNSIKFSSMIQIISHDR